jgi:hypothetical protein
MFFQVRLRESEMQALHEERSKREALERTFILIFLYSLYW